MFFRVSSESRQELNARKADLRNIETEKFDPLTALGRYMPGLVQAIRQNANKVKNRVFFFANFGVPFWRHHIVW